MSGSTAFHAGRTRRVRRLLTWLLVAGVLPVLAGEPAQTSHLRLATGSPGGTYHKIGSDLATILPFVTTDTYVQTIQTTGSHENLKLLSDGEADLALTTEDAFIEFRGKAHDGSESAPGAEAGQEICVLGVLYVGAAQFVLRKDLVRSGTLDDLEGAALYPGAAGSGTESSTLAILDALDIDPRLVPAQQRTLTYDESASALRQGEVKFNAVVLSGGPPVSALAELLEEAPGEFVILAWTPEHIRKATEAIPGLVASEIAAGTYRGQDAAIPSVGKRTLLVARRGLGSSELARIKNGVDDFLKYIDSPPDPNRKAVHPALADLVPRYWFGSSVEGMCLD